MSTRPTDLELMAYADGELDDPRRAQVEAFLAVSPDAQAKLAGLRVVGDVVRELAREPASGAADVDLTDAILAHVEREALPARKRLPRVEVGAPPPRSRRSANDNAFRIFSFAAAAVAVAAGVMIWARTEPAAPLVALGVPSRAVSIGAAPGPMPSHAAAAYEAEAEVGASIAAVDFGSNTGSIFYVPAGLAMTTVVWVAETGPGEQ